MSSADLSSHPRTLLGHEAAVYALAAWPLGGIVSGGGDGLVAHWSLGGSTDGRALTRIDDRVVRLLPVGSATGPFGKTAADAPRGGGSRDDAPAGADAGRAGPVLAEADEPQVALAVGTLSGDLYWVRTDGSAPRRWRLHRDGLFGLVQAGGRVFACGGSGTLSSWDAASGGPLRHRAVESVRLRGLAWLPTPRLLACGTANGDLLLVEPDGLRAVHVVERAHERTVFDIADAGDRFYTCGRDGAIRAWATEAPFGQLDHVPAHAATVNALAYASAAETLVSAGRDRELRVWDREPDGLRLRKVLDGPRDGGHVASVNACCLLPGGGIASGGDDRTVRVWSVPA